MPTTRKEADVEIGGIPHKVVLCDLAEEQIDGDYDWANKQIRIDSSEDPSHYYSTYAHEVCHAALEIAGLTHILKGVSPDLEETIVRVFENLAFPAILKFNDLKFKQRKANVNIKNHK